MIRYTARLGAQNYVLAQGHDIDALKAEIVQAVRSGGDFVDMIVFGNRMLSILVTVGVPIVFEGSDVDEDERDTGDVNEPFALLDEWAL